MPQVTCIFLQVVQPHVPLIKFRKGTHNPVAGATAAPSARPVPTQQSQSTGSATGPGVIALPTIEDVYLPPRYQRRPIDQREIDYINRGGPE
ncbi:28S ribosomal protein S36, mitochondrial isoform X2 [Ooceraea biroi]|uniref:28S ribosomal protein S36, mitochondrial isoform X2 n=1 Tax=Ooceraea biroi TaxID=2015173 RepID=UPI0005BB23EA|nr:28S ribosomal protein S36, mitochondrial isoform X2 [Ooceraea biroi]